MHSRLLCLRGCSATSKKATTRGPTTPATISPTSWWVQENLVVAQQGGEEKSNEITAVPELLKMLDLKGAVVTADAINTQKTIAEQIVKAGGDYLLAVKGNHPTLEDCIRRHLDE